MQMAIDRWLLQQHVEGKHPSVLRFYTWSSPAISLGYHQRRYPAFWDELAGSGVVELVRRPTGGRAVLHDLDLTYMVVTSHFTGKRLEVYERICAFLIEGWRSLGITLHYGKAERNYIHNPNCFGTATGADLVTPKGYKLIGSAQLKKGNAVLQHGSMSWSRNGTLFRQVFNESVPPFSLPFSSSREEVIVMLVEALIAAARQTFDIEFVVQPLSVSEWEEIALNKNF